MCKDIVCRKKPETDLLVKIKLKTTFHSNLAINYGLEHEAEGMDEYVSFRQQTEPDCFLRKSGLVVSTEAPYLACSPDGILCTSSGQILVEVKCPYRCQNSSLVEVPSQDAPFFMELADHNSNILWLKRNHSYYYLVQMSLLVTQLPTVDFVVWTLSELFTERIKSDDDLLLAALPKLEEFCHGKLL